MSDGSTDQTKLFGRKPDRQNEDKKIFQTEYFYFNLM